MENGNAYQVSQVVVRQSPLVNATGQVQQTTTVTFMVGAHGPFTLSWPGASPAPNDIIASIKAKVDQLKQVGAALNQLNQSP